MAAGSRAFVVRFSDTSRWDIGFFRAVEWAWPAEVIRPVGVGLQRRSEAVAASLPLRDVPIIEKISFGGVLSVTEPAEREGYKGRLFWARPGELVYSKIRVKQGSIALIPESEGSVAVSAEYPVFAVDTDVFVPEYLTRVVRGQAFLSLLEGLAHGGSTKTRIHPTDFEALCVPILPKRVQRAIVAQAERAEAALREAEAEATRRREAADLAFLAGLGLTLSARRERSKVMTLRWSEMERWGVMFNQLAGASAALAAGRFAPTPLSKVLSLVQYGTSEKANTAGQGVPVVRICNVKDGVVDLSDVKHVILPASTTNTLRLLQGDILIIRTSGSRDLVGTTAVVPEGLGEAVFASYLIRLRVDSLSADPWFVSAFLNGPFGRRQVDMTSRQIMQSNINAEEIRALQIPLPPLKFQRDLADQLRAGRAAIDDTLAAARAAHATALAEVDAMILGTLPVPGA